MEKKKPTGMISSRLFCFLILTAFALLSMNYLTRELWFDEVLTLQFANLSSVAEIYRSYTIPNNQIIHTVFIHWLLNGGMIPEFLRFFPLFCAALMLFLLWKNFCRELGRGPLLLALGSLVLSPPFLLYSSAVRGYMLAALFCVCALCAARKYALGGKWRFAGAWLCFSMLAAGVMPSALAGIAGAGLYVLPYCGKKFWKHRKSYLLAVMPFAAFILFYLPIFSDLQKAFELKEGWHHGGSALLALAAAVVTTFSVPLLSGMFFHRPKWRYWPRMLIWFLPLGGLLLPVAPFPRVWFVLFPLFALLCAGYLRRLPEKFALFAGASILIWGTVTSLEVSRELISPVVSLGGQDDFFAPRFATARFTPSATAEFIQHRYGSRGAAAVFASFDSDPFALLYYLPLNMDVPPGKCRYLPSGTLIVLSIGEEPADYALRFNGTLTEVYRNALHRVFLFRKTAL
ncbi:MAG: hypothetical protein IKC94_00035 [Lentisphaeria bacterium]|nr:hypothetical protein [Lentisphaeria bacterium]